MLILSRSQVRALLDLDRLIEALAEAFVALSDGRASAPPRGAAFVPDTGLLAGMPGRLPGALAAKLVTLFPGNPERGLPGHQAVITVFDEATGRPLALMDGTEITAVRTAAASALAVRTLARADARVLAIVGAGVQGHAHALAVPRVRRFDEVRVASRSPQRGAALAREFGATAAGSIEAAVRGADVVCLCTEAATQVIDATWVSPGAHVGSVGYSATGSELDPRLLRAGRLFVEARVAFQPPPAGAAELHGLDPAGAAEMGEVLAGRAAGRRSAEEITVYKSMGHAVEDVAAARLVYEAAVAAGAGVEVDVEG